MVKRSENSLSDKSWKPKSPANNKNLKKIVEEPQEKLLTKKLVNVKNAECNKLDREVEKILKKSEVKRKLEEGENSSRKFSPLLSGSEKENENKTEHKSRKRLPKSTNTRPKFEDLPISTYKEPQKCKKRSKKSSKAAENEPVEQVEEPSNKIYKTDLEKQKPANRNNDIPVKITQGLPLYNKPSFEAKTPLNTELLYPKIPNADKLFKIPKNPALTAEVNSNLTETTNATATETTNATATATATTTATNRNKEITFSKYYKQVGKTFPLKEKIFDNPGAKDIYMDKHNFENVLNSPQYTIIHKYSRGEFGTIYNACLGDNYGVLVSMKKLEMDHNRKLFARSSLRDVFYMKKFNNTNIAKFYNVWKRVIYNRPHYFMTFEHCKHDLGGIIQRSEVKLTPNHVKYIIFQLLQAVSYLHSIFIVHRDIKSSSVLITNNGYVKLSDFDMARSLNAPELWEHSNYRRGLRWNCAPEVLLGEKNDMPSMDVWSLGCVVAEMVSGSVLMKGANDGHQLKLICRLRGSITPEIWPTVEQLPYYKEAKLIVQRPDGVDILRTLTNDPYFLNLMEQLLTLDPYQRVTAEAAINHGYFWNQPPPQTLQAELEKLPEFKELHSSMKHRVASSTYKKVADFDPNHLCSSIY